MWRGKVVTPRHYILMGDWAFPPQRPKRKMRIRNMQAGPSRFGTQRWPMMAFDHRCEAIRLHEIEPCLVGCPAL